MKPGTNIFYELKPYIQPFERTLALKELERVTGSNPRRSASSGNTIYTAPLKRPLNEIINVLTYWQSVWRSNNVSLVIHTVQVRIEAAHGSFKRTGIQTKVPVLPNRRELRYGPHGIHEYRGKFFPQLVGALLNIAGIPKDGLIVDLMCGSGTTIVESAIRGHTAIGIDMNPLSVLLTNAKSGSLQIPHTQLKLAHQKLVRRVQIKDTSGSWIKTLPANDREYLANWFAPKALKELDILANAIYQEADQSIREIFFISLSNILRRVSFQKVEDLRVRRKSEHEVPEPVMKTFFTELDKTVGILTGFKSTFPQERKVGNGYAVEGDARRASEILSKHIGKIDAIITSPPYATALPYLDTDRLSLSFLDLLPRSEHRDRDFDMIGNRELTTSLANRYWDLYKKERTLLPIGVRKMIEHLKEVNSKPGVGFRRQNLPYLLAKYFFDMRKVIQEMYALLKPGGYAFVVIGNNSTTAGGKSVHIQTDKWLAEIAKTIGFSVTDKIPMEMLISRDIFKENAIAKESILFLQKPKI